MNLSKTGSLWLSKKLRVVVIVGFLLLLKIPTIDSAVDRSITTSGTYTIPAGVKAMEVDLWGAGGSGSGFKNNDKSAYAGGSGSYVRCQLAITGPTTITVIVGDGGQAPAYGASGSNAIGGGGKGVADSNQSPGGGGGRSAIKNPSTPAEDWVTAGGGGGGGTADSFYYVMYTS
jgi:hypothetical protein